MRRKMFRAFFVVFVIACSVSFSFQAIAAGTDKSSPVTTVEKKKSKKKSFPGQENLLDINTATSGQLKALPGLNDEDIKKIIAGRPYARKNQLKQKNIISASTYDGIKSAIVAKKAPK